MPEYSFFNFALNGCVPSYYQDWYEIFENEAHYPKPKAIVWCVDWFMFDTDWLWRRITFDSPADMPLGIMRGENRGAESCLPDESGGGEELTEPVTLSETAGPQREKTVSEFLRESVDEHGLFALDEHVTVLLVNNRIFSSRDRIPEMIRYWLDGGKLETERPAAPRPRIKGELLTEADLVLSVYEHEELRDRQGNITSLYYKGYIPWDMPFGGGTFQVGCSKNSGEWAIFKNLIAKFEKEGGSRSSSSNARNTAGGARGTRRNTTGSLKSTRRRKGSRSSTTTPSFCRS